MARDFALRPKMCRPALHLCIPPRCAAHEKKIIGPEDLGTHQSPIWWAHGRCDSCACVNLILRRTENLGGWSISLVREKRKLSFISQLVVTRPPPPPGGYSWEFLVRVCRPVLQILTLFQTKKCNFPHLFSDQTSNVHTRFQTWPSGRNYVIIT